jgi:hypothetical protein
MMHEQYEVIRALIFMMRKFIVRKMVVKGR